MACISCGLDQIELAEPKFGRAFWNVREFASNVSMPKTSIYKQRDAFRWRQHPARIFIDSDWRHHHSRGIGAVAGN
jgi:hypothetical protein